MSGLTQPTEERDADEAYHSHAVRAVPLGPPSDDQLALIRAHVVDGAILDEHEPFAWQVQASNNQEDAYATRMHASTLKNFAADALAGVAFMNSHRTGGMLTAAELPLGRTFDARMIGASGNGVSRLEVTAYTLRGLNLTGLSTDAFIDGMRSGIVRDVSVGFHGGEYRCSICDRDMRRDWDCRHFPGIEYPVVDTSGSPTGDVQRAVAWIRDAHLSEISAVFDGATPGCMVLKAKRMAEAGELKPAAIDLLEQRYRMALPHPARSFAGAEIPPQQEGDAMPTGNDTGGGAPITEQELASVRLALTEVGLQPDAPLAEGVRALVDEAKTLRALSTEVESLRPLVAEVARLQPLADQGVAYRQSLVDGALIEGARAYGADFAEETYRGLLEAAPLETVKRMASDWQAIGDKTFPAGRLTKDEPTPITTSRRPRVPAAARG